MSARPATYLDLRAELHGAFMHPGGRDLTRFFIRELAALPEPRHVLDVGCGTAGGTALVAAMPGTRVVGIERSARMLAGARRRARQRRPPFLIQGDAAALPFGSDGFDAVYAESVVALLDAPVVLAEMRRVLRPDGLLLLNERVWKEGVTGAEADEVNAASLSAFGIPAATREALSWREWVRMLGETGFSAVSATPVDRLRPRARRTHIGQRLAHGWRYLARPSLLPASRQFKASASSQPELWARLESFVFLGRRRAKGGHTEPLTAPRLFGGRA